MSEQRITLERREDGAYLLPCGCRLDYFDGPPITVIGWGVLSYPFKVEDLAGPREFTLQPGQALLIGATSPHIHTTGTCPQHDAPPSAAPRTP